MRFDTFNFEGKRLKTPTSPFIFSKIESRITLGMVALIQFLRCENVFLFQFDNAQLRQFRAVVIEIFQ